MKYILISIIVLSSFNGFPQRSPPWEHPLKIAWSTDGTTFSNISIFQDSSGVPSITKWKGDTLISVFQWFRQPMNSLTWDKVAVKFSYDAGISWSLPVPISVNGFPVNYQRPFDPAITAINNDSLRIYFSSSDGMPSAGMDSIINTYSAVSTDGINFTFEPGARFDNSTNRVIDPSVIYFNGEWNYLAPIGAPQDGAYHCLSNDGIHFNQQNNYISDFMHNWTGNYMINDSSELRFYGSGPQVWYNSSLDGLNWQGYVNTNINGGDPAVIQTGNTSYLMIFVGESYITGTKNFDNEINLVSIYPNPFQDFLQVKGEPGKEYSYATISSSGKIINIGKITGKGIINLTDLAVGIYFLETFNDDSIRYFKIIKY